MPETFEDDYKNRAKAASAAKIKVEADLDYFDLGLVQPEGGDEVGERHFPGNPNRKGAQPGRRDPDAAAHRQRHGRKVYLSNAR